jgi:hypothetical protein
MKESPALAWEFGGIIADAGLPLTAAGPILLRLGETKLWADFTETRFDSLL